MNIPFLSKQNSLPQWLKIVQPISPYLATVFQSQYCRLAVQLCLEEYHITSVSVVDDYQTIANFILAANSNQLKRLSVLEQQLKKELKELHVEDSDLDIQSKHQSINIMSTMILTLITTLGFFLVLLFMLFFDIPTTGRDALLIMLGALSSGWNSILSYYFGSSSGQDQMIKQSSSQVDSPE